MRLTSTIRFALGQVGPGLPQLPPFPLARPLRGAGTASLALPWESCRERNTSKRHDDTSTGYSGSCSSFSSACSSASSSVDLPSMLHTQSSASHGMSSSRNLFSLRVSLCLRTQAWRPGLEKAGSLSETSLAEPGVGTCNHLKTS